MDQWDKRRQLWGRSLSRPLSPRQQDSYDRGCRELVIKEGHAKDVLDSFWSRYDHYILEIGFGDGEHFITHAKAFPQTGFLGCERFINGMANVMSIVYDQGLSNVRLFPDDVHLILKYIPSHVFSKIYVLFPDPWPKKKHKKRRLLNRTFMKECYALLQRGGKLCMASDIEEYRHFIEDEMKGLTDFFTRHPDENAPLTKYGRKAEREGRTSRMLVFETQTLRASMGKDSHS